MVKSVENGVSVPPFLLKCYEMVDDESTDALISWTQSQPDSFIISDVAKFCSELLPKYFKHSNFSSFVRQLNIYGFRKVDTDRWEFANDKFVRGQKHLLANIIRRKNAQTLAPKTTLQEEETKPLAPEEDKRLALRQEVENLKTDKNALMQELVKLRQHQQNSQRKLLLLREQVKGMEKNQQQMLSFIVMGMQNPGFLVQFMQPKESNRIVAETDTNVLSELDDEVEDNPELTKGVLVKYQSPPPAQGNPEKPIELDFPLGDIKDFFKNLDFSMGGFNEGNSDQLVIPEMLEEDAEMLEMLLSSPVSEIEESNDSLRSETPTQVGDFEGMDLLTEKMGLTKF